MTYAKHFSIKILVSYSRADSVHSCLWTSSLSQASLFMFAMLTLTLFLDLFYFICFCDYAILFEGSEPTKSCSSPEQASRSGSLLMPPLASSMKLVNDSGGWNTSDLPTLSLFYSMEPLGYWSKMKPSSLLIFLLYCRGSSNVLWFTVLGCSFCLNYLYPSAV